MISFSRGARWPAGYDQPFRTYPGRGRAAGLGTSKISFFAPPRTRRAKEAPRSRQAHAAAVRSLGRAPGGAAAQKISKDRRPVSFAFLFSLSVL